MQGPGGQPEWLLRVAGQARKHKDRVLTEKIKASYQRSRGTYGTPRIKADRPNQKWVTDITYLPTTEGWLYLATVMDLFSRKMVGWALNERLHTLLVMDALNMAWHRRQPEAELLHHSDRGSQYTSEVYRQALERLEAVQSMSNKGKCWDNAVQESFFSTLKVELDLLQPRAPRAQTRSEVFEWIEVFYNRQRRHSSLGYCSPVAFEEQAPPS